MATNVGGNGKVNGVLSSSTPSNVVVIAGQRITEKDIQELQKHRDRSAKKAAYHQQRNQKPSVKLKNAEYHEKRNKKIRAFAAAFDWMRESNKISERLLQEVEDQVLSYKEYVAEYELNLSEKEEVDDVDSKDTEEGGEQEE